MAKQCKHPWKVGTARMCRNCPLRRRSKWRFWL